MSTNDGTITDADWKAVAAWLSRMPKMDLPLLAVVVNASFHHLASRLDPVDPVVFSAKVEALQKAVAGR
jgi:hypothetical protein